MGTPDYISPEVLNAINKGEDSCGSICDWWSLGCVMWEMLFGSPPFYATTLADTYAKITDRGNKKVCINIDSLKQINLVNYNLYLQIPLPFPDDVEVSNDAKDLLEELLCSANSRLGKYGFQDFEKHPFFITIDWNNIRQSI